MINWIKKHFQRKIGFEWNYGFLVITQDSEVNSEYLRKDY